MCRHGKVVAETDETNNCRASTSQLSVGNLPDLVETAATDPPTSLRPGGNVAVTDTVLNQGTVAAGSSTTRYYFSLDTSCCIGDVPLVGSRAVPSLDPGASSTGTVTVTVPLSLTRGPYFLLTCADDDSVVTEVTTRTTAGPHWSRHS